MAGAVDPPRRQDNAIPHDSRVLCPMIDNNIRLRSEAFGRVHNPNIDCSLIMSDPPETISGANGLFLRDRSVEKFSDFPQIIQDDGEFHDMRTRPPRDYDIPNGAPIDLSHVNYRSFTVRGWYYVTSTGRGRLNTVAGCLHDAPMAPREAASDRAPHRYERTPDRCERGQRECVHRVGRAQNRAPFWGAAPGPCSYA